MYHYKYPKPQSTINSFQSLFQISNFNQQFKQKSINFFNQQLNLQQKEAVMFALSQKEVALIHGPPGTGKTSTLVEIALQLLEKNQKILIVSPSNVAVDTIAERLLTQIPPKKIHENRVIRLGHPVRMLSSVKKINLEELIETKYSIAKKIYENELLREKCDSKQERKKYKNKIKQLLSDREEYVQEMLFKSDIIFSTTYGSGNMSLLEVLKKNNTYFDVIILDEAAQAKECECYVPILLGKK
jgi:superfamily I DNA and/or RNA helicase